jgi:NTE family protein
MGAVIGGLYASGLSTDEIERVVGGLDPSKVALDQLNRLELPSRTRAYQQKYPVDFEFGVKNGEASFARGVSDGQRFLALLQDLTSHVPPQVNFNDLKIPFRAVATRYRDGEMKVFDQGACTWPSEPAWRHLRCLRRWKWMARPTWMVAWWPICPSKWHCRRGPM